MAQTRYIPGVCNIGPAETTSRRRIGWFSLAAAVVITAVIFALGLPAYTRAIAFIPLTIAASGFIQAQLHFCAGFGAAGVFNFGSQIGQTDTVTQADYRAKDKRKAVQITTISVLIGAVISGILVLI
ncbi:hypothetical protein HJC99_06300 [Candidatus Saccharibacteria bacterium]|nr:hypothetical protein [Candidatus Saccharibacteria bacterium]